jgi:hypothetical protein
MVSTRSWDILYLKRFLGGPPHKNIMATPDLPSWAIDVTQMKPYPSIYGTPPFSEDAKVYSSIVISPDCLEITVEGIHFDNINHSLLLNKREPRPNVDAAGRLLSSQLEQIIRVLGLFDPDMVFGSGNTVSNTA